MINLINFYDEINCQLLSNYEEDKINIINYPNCSNKHNGTLKILKSDKFNLIKNNFNSKDIDIIHNNLIKVKDLFILLLYLYLILKIMIFLIIILKN